VRAKTNNHLLDGIEREVNEGGPERGRRKNVTG